MRGAVDVWCGCAWPPAAEEIYCGPSKHNGDYGDTVMARSYLAARYNDEAWIEAELIRHRNAIARLVQRPWVRRRIKRVAAALLEHGRLTSDEINALL